MPLSVDQDQDSLLVKRRNNNHSPGPVMRELVPSSHQRSGGGDYNSKVLEIMFFRQNVAKIYFG